jgi:hypothetical protein
MGGVQSFGTVLRLGVGAAVRYGGSCGLLGFSTEALGL